MPNVILGPMEPIAWFLKFIRDYLYEFMGILILRDLSKLWKEIRMYKMS